ncbi:MAG: ABC-three component system middle component 6, partial [Pseudomonadota bacterium]
MILPTKHLRPERALITVGAEMLVKLKRPATVSRLWDD